MNIENDAEQEEMALEALIAAALWDDPAEAGLLDESAALTPEDLRVLEASAPGRVARVRQLAAEEAARSSTPPPPPSFPMFNLATAMNRGKQDSDLSEKAKQEMEERRRALDESEGEGPERK